MIRLVLSALSAPGAVGQWGVSLYVTVTPCIMVSSRSCGRLSRFYPTAGSGHDESWWQIRPEAETRDSLNRTTFYCLVVLQQRGGGGGGGGSGDGEY